MMLQSYLEAAAILIATNRLSETKIKPIYIAQVKTILAAKKDTTNIPRLPKLTLDK